MSSKSICTQKRCGCSVGIPVQPALSTEYGVVAQRLLPRNVDETVDYDVLIVGSGMGGGILASALADAGANVLVPEAGSLLFPTHVGNLPRQLEIGRFDKNTWQLWPDFGVTNYTNAEGSDFRGGQAFNVGGRSVFWGGLTPRQTAWQLGSWPEVVRDYLIGDGYEAAEARLNSAKPPPSTFQQRSKTFLEQTIKGFQAEDAPMAIQYVPPAPWMIPAGLFSTVDLLLEDALRLEPPAPLRRPTVNVNHAVRSVTLEGTRATGVRCYDMLDGVERNYKGGAVVLCAGTIESAKIALLSDIAGASDLVGRGITDHTIRYRHFTVPPAVAEATMTDSAKIVLQHPEASTAQHAFDIIVELGTELNQGRYVDLSDLAADENIRNGWMMCEIVFQYYADLREENFVEIVGADPATPVSVRVDPAPPPPAVEQESDEIARAVLTAYGAEPVLNEGAWPALTVADLGGVAHEVGTLRMTATDDGVVDTDLAFLGYSNLYACDNSVFPASPAANPSLTTVALALRLATHLRDH
jgi:choline dehydrogenase-like flavoprotein